MQQYQQQRVPWQVFYKFQSFLCNCEIYNISSCLFMADPGTVKVGEKAWFRVDNKSVRGIKVSGDDEKEPGTEDKFISTVVF